MEVMIRFKDPYTTPADYVISEVDMLEVTWDDVGIGYPFIIEGAESVILRIVSLARQAGNIESFIVL
jgi:hypothetical protein